MQYTKKLFTRELSWLNRFDSSKVAISHSDFHYLTHPEPGYKKVKLYIQDEHTVCPIHMYYAKINNQNDLILDQTIKQQKPLDLSYLNGFLTERKKGVTINDIQNKSLWVQKYSQMKYYQLITQQYLNRNLLNWVKSWDKTVFKNQKPAPMKAQKKFGVSVNQNIPQASVDQFSQNKLILLAGPPGCGKTTLARVCALKAGYRYIEINASDDRTAKALIMRLQNMTKNQTINQDKKPTFIIVDQVDGALQSDSNGIKQVLHYIQTGDMGNSKKNDSKNKQYMHIRRPVLFICNDPYAKGLKQLRKKATIMKFPKIKTQKLVQLLKNVCNKQQVYLSSEILYKICEINDNDIRSSLSMLEFVAKAKVNAKLEPLQILNKIKWEAKDNGKNMMGFINQILCQRQKSKNIDLQKLQQNLIDLDYNASLLLETLFLNYRNCKSIYRNIHLLPRFLQTICQSDRLINQSFDYSYQLNKFLILPYLYFKIFLKNNQIQKLEYPAAFFDRLAKHKNNNQILEKLRDGVNTSIKPFVTIKKLSSQYLFALFYCIQPMSNQQQQLINCLRTMIKYGIQFANNTAVNNATSLYNPQIDKLLQYGKKPLTILLTNITKNLMLHHYKEVKTNTDLFETHDGHQIQTNLKKTFEYNKKKKRDSNTIKYKFLEGTGTEIKYELKSNYFFI